MNSPESHATGPDCRSKEARLIEEYFDRLWPILRSLTGEGVRETHSILGELLPLVRHEFASGSHALDWIVPEEWLVREAYVIAPDGQRILDVTENNLHLLNYSAPFRGTVDRAELDAHLHSDPERPNAIPYRTSYYERRWGFCIPHKTRMALPEGSYTVVIDTEFVAGGLTLSEATLPGHSDRQVLFTAYTCHPSLAINELSGPLLTAFLYRRIAAIPDRRHTYRFVFGPETLGAICYLSEYGDELIEKLDAGFITTCVGDAGSYTYKRSKRQNTLSDRAALNVLRRWDVEHRVVDFHPSGSDERQYCSMGFNLPVGSLMRTAYGEYPEYHTSDDNKSLMDFEAMCHTLDLYEEIVRVMETNQTVRNRITRGEPQFSRRGDLYPQIGHRLPGEFALAVKWLTHYADGKNDLLAISDMSGIDFDVIAQAAHQGEQLGLFELNEPVFEKQECTAVNRG